MFFCLFRGTKLPGISPLTKLRKFRRPSWNAETGSRYRTNRPEKELFLAIPVSGRVSRRFLRHNCNIVAKFSAQGDIFSLNLILFAVDWPFLQPLGKIVWGCHGDASAKKASHRQCHETLNVQWTVDPSAVSAFCQFSESRLEWPGVGDNGCQLPSPLGNRPKAISLVCCGNSTRSTISNRLSTL